jgi:hypothetical protein
LSWKISQLGSMSKGCGLNRGGISLEPRREVGSAKMLSLMWKRGSGRFARSRCRLGWCRNGARRRVFVVFGRRV